MGIDEYSNDEEIIKEKVKSSPNTIRNVADML